MHLTRILRRATILRATILALSGAAAAGTLASADPLDALAACRDESDDAAKIACFEAATQTLLDARESGDLYIVESETVDELDRQTFGLALPSLPSIGIRGMFSRRNDEGGDSGAGDGGRMEALVEEQAGSVVATERSDDGQINEVSMTIASADRGADGKLIFRMENGQIWRQIDDDRLYIPRDIAGRSAYIKRASLGSYRLRFDGNRSAIRVRRDE